LHCPIAKTKVCHYGKKYADDDERILDRLDVVREELHSLQIALEKLATREGTPGSNLVPDGSEVGP
jgi:hypothetical protein